MERTALLCNNFSLDFNNKALDVYLNKQNCDCTFLVEGTDSEEEKLFQCNKMILSFASPVFEDLLCGSSPEAKKAPNDPIRIGGFSPSCFDIAMRFIYGKKIEKFSSLLQATQVAIFALQWQIKFLHNIASSQFEVFETSEGEYLQLYELCTKMNDKDNAKHYFQKCFYKNSEVFVSEAWLSAAKSTVSDVLSANENSEIIEMRNLLIALVRWGEHQVASRGGEEGAEATRAELTDLLPLIKFRLCSTAEFGELCEMECCSILSDSEKVAISKCLMSGEASDMPPGFNTDDRRQRLRTTYLENGEAHTAADIDAMDMESLSTSIGDLMNELDMLEKYLQMPKFKVEM